jgi:E3 ubiquitin-protein ligase TRIP12
VHELVKILSGTRNEVDDDNNNAQLVALLALSGGGQYQVDEDPKAQVLAICCLANFMEALPGVAHTMGPFLCSVVNSLRFCTSIWWSRY